MINIKPLDTFSFYHVRRMGFRSYIFERPMAVAAKHPPMSSLKAPERFDMQAIGHEA
jgi:hypothetical protein